MAIQDSVKTKNGSGAVDKFTYHRESTTMSDLDSLTRQMASAAASAPRRSLTRFQS